MRLLLLGSQEPLCPHGLAFLQISVVYPAGWGLRASVQGVDHLHPLEGGAAQEQFRNREAAVSGGAAQLPAASCEHSCRAGGVEPHQRTRGGLEPGVHHSPLPFSYTAESAPLFPKILTGGVSLVFGLDSSIAQSEF